MTNTLAMRAVQALAQKFGTTVERVLWTDTSLVLSGAGWRVTTASAWRITLDGRILVGAEDPDAEAGAMALSGAVLQAASVVAGLDPSMQFADGRFLEIFSSCAVDPWVIDVDGHPIFVGSPTTPDDEQAAYDTCRNSTAATAWYDSSPAERVGQGANPRGASTLTNTLAEWAVQALAQRVGTTVERVLWTGTSLVLSGAGWRVTTASAWRITLDGRMLVGAEDPDAKAAATALSGAVLKTASVVARLDPSLQFVDGRFLEIFSSCAVGPWVINVDGYPIFGS